MGNEEQKESCVVYAQGCPGEEAQRAVVRMASGAPASAVGFIWSMLHGGQWTDIADRQASQLKSSASTPLSLSGPYSSFPVIRSPYDSTMNWSSSAAGLAPPFAPMLAPASSAELPTFAPPSVVQMPPSIRPPQTSRTYDKAIEEGDAMEMEGVIQALAETLRQKKVRAEEAQTEADRALKEVSRARKEVDSAQLLLDDADRKQKYMFIAERSKGNWVDGVCGVCGVFKCRWRPFIRALFLQIATSTQYTSHLARSRWTGMRQHLLLRAFCTWFKWL